MRLQPAFASWILCGVACSAGASDVAAPAPVRRAPVDAAVTALVSQLVDPQASEYRAARRVHSMPGHEGVALAFFTVEGFGGGNNDTFYLAAFQRQAGTGASRRYRLLGVDQIGGGGWRFVDTDRIDVAGDCVTLDTKGFAAGDPMSHPTLGGTATYCLRNFPGQANPALEPAGDDPARPAPGASGPSERSRDGL